MSIQRSPPRRSPRNVGMNPQVRTSSPANAGQVRLPSGTVVPQKPASVSGNVNLPDGSVVEGNQPPQTLADAAMPSTLNLLPSTSQTATTTTDTTTTDIHSRSVSKNIPGSQPPSDSQGNCIQLQLLQTQIDFLQTQLTKAQSALKTALNPALQSASTIPLLQTSNEIPTLANTAGIFNAASADFSGNRTQSLLSGASSVAATPNNFSGSQFPLSINPSVISGNQGLLMHRKIYDLPEFDGSAEEWPMFSAAFEQTTVAYQYNEFENCQRLQKALKGYAKESVKSLLIHPENVSVIMDQLRIQFGQPDMLVRCQLQKLKEIQPIGENGIEKLINLSINVQNLTAFLQTAHAQQHIANPTLMDELISKIPMSKRMEWALHASTIKPYPTILDFNKWLKGVADLVRMVYAANLSRPNTEGKRKVVLHANDQRKPDCVLCKGSHRIIDCKRFLAMDISNRWDEVKKLKLCFSCLDSGHSSRNCRRRKTCPIDGCRRKHNKILHADESSVADPRQAMPVQNDTNNYHSGSEAVLSCVTNVTKKDVLLFRVVPIVLYGPNKRIETYALLDEGSSVTMMDSSLVKELGLQSRSSKLNLQWYAGNAAQENASVVNVHVSGIGRQRKYVLQSVYGVSSLKLPTQSFDMDLSRHPNLPIKTYNGVVPKVLIGLDHCHLGLPDEIVPLGECGPYAANTPLGWIVFGKINGKSNNNALCLMSVQVDNNIHDLLANYFENENFGVKVLPVIESKDDTRAKTLLNNTIKVGERFQSPLLWKSDHVNLPDSYSMALNRLRGIERKMENNIEFGEAYKEIIKSYVAKGYVRKLSHDEVSVVCPRTWYLPHFGVVNANKPGKLRLVFDAAAKVEGVSLNSNLLKGPQQYRPLPAILFNFRIGTVGVCGDIREMFHQVLVAPEDRCSQRFLWRDQKDKPPAVYEMMVMTFGAACSPCVAQHVRDKNAIQYREKYPRAVKSIVDHHYVDDFVDSFSSSARAIEIAKQVREIHKMAGFELRSFSSNSQDVVLALSGNISEPVNFNRGVEEIQSEKVLGMFWQPKEDSFKFRIKCHNVKSDVMDGHRRPTKRELLSVVMSIFDPLGFLSNFLISAKLLMREVWKHDIPWDEYIPDFLAEIWNNWREEIHNVHMVSIPRCYFKNLPIVQLELHVFVDASEDAFGAVAYWRSITADGLIYVSFVASKTKCAPLKTMTIPRLELQAAVMGTRLLETILKEHAVKVQRFICWSDSTTVINWIGSKNRRYKPFVAHRIAEILETTSPMHWRWIPSNLNVADETTRMKSKVDFSNNSRWFKGPSFLYNDESKWPEPISRNLIGPFEEELPAKVLVLLNRPSFFDYSRFSSFLKLKRTVAWVLRFIKHCKKKRHPNEKYGLKADELKSAEILLCQEAQKDAFSQEISILKNKENLPKGSELQKLSPYIDEHSLLRVYGRIAAASWLPLESRHPIILPKSHPLTELYVTHIHTKLKHQNFEATIAEIRRLYWIPRLRNILRKCISNCNFCRFSRVVPIPPLMSSLPEDRVTPYMRPFSYTGIDYFGPVSVTVGRHQEKRWVALFTCLSVRAVHLEIAYDLSTDACIIAIRNFINRRGTPTKIRSDNGKNFIGADRVAKQFAEVFDVVRVQDELSTKGIEWQFNCPHNPAAGGAWERMVQCVKRVLRITLKESSPREHTFQCFLIEAENIVNSRPLTHLPLSHEEEEPLTPNHFIIGTANAAQTPATAITDKPVVLRKQWIIARQLRDHFWKRWISEYLPTLTRRAKWCNYTKPVAVGDLVLICDSGVSRREWKRGRVVQVVEGNDGVIRSADVKTSTTILRRPVSKLAILDVI